MAIQVIDASRKFIFMIRCLISANDVKRELHTCVCMERDSSDKDEMGRM